MEVTFEKACANSWRLDPRCELFHVALAVRELFLVTAFVDTKHFCFFLCIRKSSGLF